MALAWTPADPAQALKGADPYVHWWAEQERDGPADRFVPCPVDAVLPPDARGRQVYAPRHAANPAPPCAWDLARTAARLPKDLPRDTVLMGIVDTGIALGHRRFRRPDGTTRFVSCWQQSAAFAGQPDLPFGQDLSADQIDAALRAHSLGDLARGRLDEEAFNRALHLVEPDRRDGHRDLDFAAAHGTHVLDLAAGADPTRADGGDLAQQCRLIGVNLPAQRLHGSAGNFLVYWALYAFARVLHVADALALANADSAQGVPEGGYPVVINFSYGMQAGPKDGGSVFERALADLLAARTARGKAPVRLVMPVGNDNLDRAHARAEGPKARLDLPWRISPEDRTSNHLEIWLRGADPEADAVLQVSPPGAPPLPVPPLPPGGYSDLSDYARIYRRDTPEDAGYVLCVAPSLRLTPRPEAPAGVWRVQVAASGGIDAFIQSDQSGLRHSPTGRRSRFDHPADVVWGADGHPRDSFDYDTGADTDDLAVYGPVSMKGTQNALASAPGAVVIGGYRRSDGRPVRYGATARTPQGLDAALPSEDSPALFGLLAAGARDGSVTALRGTSMASALATRAILTAWRAEIAQGLPPQAGDSAWMQAQAQQAEATHPPPYRPAAPLKAGAGRLPLPREAEQGRPPRR